MASELTWGSLLHLRKSDFNNPENLHDSVLVATDKFISQIGVKPLFLSDYRHNDPRQHGKGRAIDTTWPALDSLDVWNAALASQLFSGLGVYLNEVNAVSFHMDTRTDRSTVNPATWGAFIKPGVTAGSRIHEYLGAATVLEAIKKKEIIVPLSVLAAVVLWWMIRNQ